MVSSPMHAWSSNPNVGKNKNVGLKATKPSGIGHSHTPEKDHHDSTNPTGFNIQGGINLNVSDTPDLETVFKLLEDNYARTILTATSIEAMSAKELAEECDSSLPTVYRRVEDLEDANLIKEETRLRKDGHHETVYVAVLDEFSVRLREGELKYEIKHRKEDKADRLKRMWEEL